MEKSATMLGREIGLSAQEMNQLLKQGGFLDGNPGDYDLTSKGLEFAVEHSFHRGPGGYPQFNADWITRKWDPRVLEHLDRSPENLKAIKDSVAGARQAERLARKAAQNAAEAKWLAKVAAEKTPVVDNAVSAGNIAKGIAIGGGVTILTVAAVKAAPHVKRWWKKKALPWLEDILS